MDKTNLIHLDNVRSNKKPNSQDDNVSDDIDAAIVLMQNSKFIEARDRLNEALEKGVLEAYLYLGKVYEIEPAINEIQDYAKAHFYYTKAAEDYGSSEANVCIADMFRFGYLGNVDYKSAMNIYLDSIRHGYNADGYISFRVGVMHVKGQGVEVDFDLANSYFKEGWELGHIPSLSGAASLQFKRKNYLKGIYLKIYSIVITVRWSIFDKNPARVRMV